jgi:hypothetical protein
MSSVTRGASAVVLASRLDGRLHQASLARLTTPGMDVVSACIPLLLLQPAPPHRRHVGVPVNAAASRFAATWLAAEAGMSLRLLSPPPHGVAPWRLEQSRTPPPPPSWRRQGTDRGPFGRGQLKRANSTNVLDEGLRIGGVGRQMNLKVRSVKQGVYRK